MTQQENQACLELLVYMLISAVALRDEPKIYGPLRLVEASQRLGQIMLNNDLSNRSLKELIAIIEEGKHKTMSDKDGFEAMLQDAVTKLVDLM